MSDKASYWFHKHVEVSEGFKKRTMSVKWKPEISVSMKEALEVISAFFWIIMVLWIEIDCILLYFFIFVSYREIIRAKTLH